MFHHLSVATLPSAQAVLRLLFFECGDHSEPILRQITGFCLLALSGTACAVLRSAVLLTPPGEDAPRPHAAAPEKDPVSNCFPGGSPGSVANVLALLHTLMGPRTDTTTGKSLKKMLCERIVTALTGTPEKNATATGVSNPAWPLCASGFLLARAGLDTLGLDHHASLGECTDVACGHDACAGAGDTGGECVRRVRSNALYCSCGCVAVFCA